MNEILKNAQTLLDEAESSIDPVKKALLLEEGLDILDDYCEEHESISEDEQKFICNVRISHTKRLLEQLLAMKNIDFGLWFKYMNLIDSRLNNERKKLFQDYPELEENYMEFFELWKVERARLFMDVLKEFKKECAS